MNEDEEFRRHHQPKQCKFCGQAAPYTPLYDESAASLQERVAIYYCHTCRAEFLFYTDSSLASSSLYTKINGKMYRWTEISTGCAMLWLVGQPGTPGVAVNKDLKMIKSFDIHDGDIIPDVTPRNVNEKIRTWLVFL